MRGKEENVEEDLDVDLYSIQSPMDIILLFVSRLAHQLYLPW